MCYLKVDSTTWCAEVLSLEWGIVTLFIQDCSNELLNRRSSTYQSVFPNNSLKNLFVEFVVPEGSRPQRQKGVS